MLLRNRENIVKVSNVHLGIELRRNRERAVPKNRINTDKLKENRFIFQGKPLTSKNVFLFNKIDFQTKS